MALFILVGIFLFPMFTLGVVLIESDYPLLGGIALFISLILSDKSLLNSEKEKKV